METLSRYLINHIAGLIWLDYVNALILIALTVYGLYRIDSRVNPLIQHLDELTKTNRKQQDIIESQAEELFELRQQVREMAYHHREVTKLVRHFPYHDN